MSLFICLARNDIPDGTVQILDLQPNTSLRVPAMDPPGQTRYVNRTPPSDPIQIQADGTLVNDVSGLSAYVIDHIEPGGLLQASGTITVAAPAALATVTINGVVFTAQNGGGPDPALQQWDMSGDNDADAASLVAAINHADSITAMKAGTLAGMYAHATAVNNVITLVARTGAAVAKLGPGGSIPLASSSGVTLAVSGSRLTRTTETWTRTKAAAVAAAIQNQVDTAGAVTAATLAGLAGFVAAGCELTSAGGSASTGTVAEVLKLLSGAKYTVKRLDASGTAQVVMTNSYTWSSAVRGGFTHNVTQYDPDLPNGLLGTVVAVDYKPVRLTFDGDSMQASMAGGQLHQLAGGITLFPKSSRVPLSAFQHGAVYAPAAGVRVVTVYNADGTVAL